MQLQRGRLFLRAVIVATCLVPTAAVRHIAPAPLTIAGLVFEQPVTGRAVAKPFVIVRSDQIGRVE